MSNQPPPFSEHSNYAQPWPPFYPPMLPPGFPPNSDRSSVGQQPALYPGQFFPFDMGALGQNAQIQGAAGQGAPAFFFPPPPPIPELNQEQLPPPPLNSLPVPVGFGYPPVPPPGSSNPPPGPSHKHETSTGGRQAQGPAISSSSGPYREEGEISEEESAPYSPPANDDQGTNHATSRDPGLGHETAIRSSSSSRSSSPYNPPLSVSADPDTVNRAIEMQKQDATASSDDSQPPRSAIQLRVQAQGALLSLATHNIRYKELVAEGISPAILKQLCDEVGLDISPQCDEPTLSAVSVSQPAKQPVSQQSPKSIQPKTQPDKIAQSKQATTRQSALPAAQTAPQSDAGKPMERKEVIARMLAAKAAKVSESPASKADAKDSQPTAIPPVGVQPKDSAMPVREKNKAQTELARQRIEELKRNALLRSQQKNQQPIQPAPSSTPGDVSSGPPTPAVQHPLPVRPPLPQTSGSGRIPGLSMTGLAQNSELNSPPAIAPGINIDPAPVPRNSQRKRPLAADFDEPVMLPKRPSSHSARHTGPAEKLIIDISDDESLYGDDEGENMDMDSSHEEDPGSTGPIEAIRPTQTCTLTTRDSTSTPQGLSRPSDHEHIRRRDLEIQAMHRKIAELEQRRKAKIAASRTGSPRTVDGPSTSSSALQLSPAEPDAAETSSGPPSQSKVALDTGTSMTSLTERPNLIDSFSDSSARLLASMDMTQLDSIRSKILRMRDVECGLPGLEVESHSSESLLDNRKQEAEQLLSEITEGKEGLQLIEELKTLSCEINGLTLEDLHELRQQAEVKEQQLMAHQVSSGNGESLVIEDSIMSDAPIPSTEPIADRLAASVPEVESRANFAAQNEVAPMLPQSDSDSSGSSMDESVEDSSSDESTRAEPPAMSGVVTASNGPSLADTAPTADGAESPMNESPDDSAGRGSFSENGPTVSERSPSSVVEPEQSQAVADFGLVAGEPMNAEVLEHPLPERPTLAVTDEIESIDKLDNQNQGDDHASAESDAYESPDPGPGTDSLDSAYSPPFSPAPPGPVEGATSMPPLDRSYPDETLMHAPQAPVPEFSRTMQTEVLGDPAPSIHLEPKFTPYVSPLRHFKAYRYHPGFVEDVSGGYRSLTYSHNIDSMKQLCPFELAGGVCNDRSCDFQHFRDMNLSDDKILIQMGAVREGQTEDEKETYLAGLKEIINEMRRDKVKEFSTVASEIAAYRRRFLQDPSRVLPL